MRPSCPLSFYQLAVKLLRGLDRLFVVSVHEVTVGVDRHGRLGVTEPRTDSFDWCSAKKSKHVCVAKVVEADPSTKALTRTGGILIVRRQFLIFRSFEDKTRDRVWLSDCCTVILPRPRSTSDQRRARISPRRILVRKPIRMATNMSVPSAASINCTVRSSSTG
jgi:hypothetical protein